GAADTGGVGRGLDVGEVVTGAPGGQLPVEHLPGGDPAGVGPVPLVIGEVGAAQQVSGQSLPLLVVDGAQDHGVAVGGAVCPVRRHRRRTHADRLLVDAG